MNKDTRIAYICILITGMCFGTMEVSCKLGGMDLDPLQLTMWRFLISAIILLPFGIGSLRKQKIRLGKRDVLELMWIGALIVPICNGLFQVAVMYANASTVGVLACTNPFFTMILARLILKERMHPVKLTALGIALCGVMLMLRFWDLQEGNTVLGMGSIILSSVCFGLYAILSRKSVERLGMTAQTSLSFLFGSLILMILLLVTHRPVFEGTIENMPILLYTGLIVTGLGYFCYLKANELAGATQASYAFFLKPVFAPILALIILHEKLLWNTIAGTILILTASAINVLHTRKTEMRENRLKQEVNKVRR